VDTRESGEIMISALSCVRGTAQAGPISISIIFNLKKLFGKSKKNNHIPSHHSMKCFFSRHEIRPTEKPPASGKRMHDLSPLRVELHGNAVTLVFTLFSGYIIP
jgi:hypothetical protein